MNETNVPETNSPQPHLILDRLTSEWDALTPEAQKAARYVLENPQDIGVSTVREIAEAASVKPNTIVRMARQVGFEGYDDFRAPFREAIRRGSVPFEDRARWLQDIAKADELGGLYADMISAAIQNIEETFNGISSEALQDAAKTIWASRKTFVLGVGVHQANARNFAYLASTGMVDVRAIPHPGSTAIDELAWSDQRDVLVAMTMKPYRAEVVEAVKIAQEQGIKVVALSDSPASPIIREADHRFVVASDTPQFFPSSISTIALLETLLSFVVSVATDEVVERIETFHRRRHQFGIYEEDAP
ncbi:MAG: MurR/RpiR family transcriptional regulator [Rhodospirillaceae bacterium]